MAELALDRGIEILARRAKAVRVVIFLFMALSAAHVIIGLATVLIGAPMMPASRAEWADSLRALAFLVSSIFVGMWIHRAHANLYAARVEGLEFTPGWSVGWFFVPVASLFKPFQAMRELWNRSLLGGSISAQQEVPELTMWWATFLIGSIIDNVTSRFDIKQDAPGSVVLILAEVAAAVAMLVSALCLLRIINNVTKAQQNNLAMAEIFA